MLLIRFLGSRCYNVSTKSMILNLFGGYLAVRHDTVAFNINFMPVELNDEFLIELQNHSAMNQQQEKMFSTTKVLRWRPQQYLSTHVQKRGKTFFSSQKHQGTNIDSFRKVQIHMNNRVLKDLVISSSTPLKNQGHLEEELKFKGAHKARKSLIRMQKSPYLTNSNFTEKMMRLLIPVKGPNQSLKLSIKKHNDMNLRNAQLLIVKRSQTFQDRMKAYSSRIGLPEDTKIFIMNSRDSHIKEALLRRGWVESGDKQSVLFHLKWTYKDELQDYQRLQQGQFFNHFKNNQELTNKNYLRKNIKKHPPEYRPNFPISFDLEVYQDSTSFEEEYIRFYMYKVLKILGLQLQTKHKRKAQQVQTGFFFASTNPKKIQKSTFSAKYVNNPVLYRRNIEYLKRQASVWQSLTNLYQFICLVAQDIQKVTGRSYCIFDFKKEGKETFNLMKKIEVDLQLGSGKLLDQISLFYCVEILKLWEQAKAMLGHSYGFNNMWIIKPAGVSRGSGITITSDLMKIVQSKYGKIVQKYIENPLLLDCQRKFDIRQWILVKSFTPFRAFAFKRCYGRLSSLKYSNQNYNNLQKHLTNYSQNKQAFLRQKSKITQNFKSRIAFTSSLSSVISQEELSNQIPQWAQVKENILKNIIRTLNCCKIDIVERDQCFQVFGFDIILDSHCRPYILEVNLSPACERREFLGEYLYEMAEGIVDLVEGFDPSNWQTLNLEQLEQSGRARLRLKERQQKARLIQQWWRRRRGSMFS